MAEKQALSSAKKKALAEQNNARSNGVKKPMTSIRLRKLGAFTRGDGSQRVEKVCLVLGRVCAKHFLKTILEETGNPREQAHEIYEKIAINVLETDLDLDEKNVAYAKSVGFETVECCVAAFVRTMYDEAVDYRGKQLSLSLANALASKRANRLKTSWPIILSTLAKLAENEGDADLTIESFVTVKVIEKECLPHIDRAYYGEVSECFSSYAHQRNEINVALSAVHSLSTVADYFSDVCHRPEGATDVQSWASKKMTPTRNGVKLNLVTKNGLADFSISPVISHLCERFDDSRVEVRDLAVQTFATLFVSRASLLSKNELKECAQKGCVPDPRQMPEDCKSGVYRGPGRTENRMGFLFSEHARLFVRKRVAKHVTVARYRGKL